MNEGRGGVWQRGLCSWVMGGQAVGASLGLGISNQRQAQNGHLLGERESGSGGMSYKDMGLESGFSPLFCFFPSST